jgi:methyl-accepting chemotaxis protein
MSEITSASREQQTGIEQVNQAVMQLDQATQQNAALVEEALAATASLHEQADDLAQVVGVFKLDAATGAGPREARAPRAVDSLAGRAGGLGLEIRRRKAPALACAVATA